MWCSWDWFLYGAFDNFIWVSFLSCLDLIKALCCFGVDALILGLVWTLVRDLRWAPKVDLSFLWPTWWDEDFLERVFRVSAPALAHCQLEVEKNHNMLSFHWQIFYEVGSVICSCMAIGFLWSQKKKKS